MIYKGAHNNFDILRLVATLCITYTHSFALLNCIKSEFLSALTQSKIECSFIGICIFFAISGDLICKSLYTSSFKSFIWKRFLRVQPLLIITMVLTIIVMGLAFTSLSKKQYFSNIETYTYLKNILPLFGVQYHLPGVFENNIGQNGVNGSIWTLIIEERLYVLMSLFFIHKKYWRWLMILFVIILNIGLLIHIFFYDSKLINYFNSSPFFYILIFLNATFFKLVNIDFEKIAKSFFPFLIILGLLILSTLLPVNINAQVIFIPMLILIIANVKSFTNGIGKYGDFTYGIYLFSFPIQQILISKFNFISKPNQLFITTIAIVIPMAMLSYFFIERKMLSYKNAIK